jgi:hypothetical protein
LRIFPHHSAEGPFLSFDFPRTAIKVMEMLTQLLEREAQHKDPFDSVHWQMACQALTANRGERIGVFVQNGFERIEWRSTAMRRQRCSALL